MLDIVAQESFVHNNKISKMEAQNLLKEVVGRQTLAVLGIKSPHLEVKLDYELGNYGASKNRNLYIELNNKDILGGKKGITPDGERAFAVLNDFVHGRRLLSPADVFRLEQKFDVSNGLIFKTNAVDQSIKPRPKRVFGKTETEAPVSFIDRLTKSKREFRKAQCKGK